MVEVKRKKERKKNTNYKIPTPIRLHVVIVPCSLVTIGVFCPDSCVLVSILFLVYLWIHVDGEESEWNIKIEQIRDSKERNVA